MTRLLLLAAGLAVGVVAGAVLLVILAQASGAGWRSRHVAAAGKLWRERL